MWQLSRIYLRNWHRFADHELEIDGSLFLTGHNGSGKSSILDAMQLVLIADLQRIRFNASAQDRSERSLDSYVRGKIGEARFLRPGNTVGYVALEFLDTERLAHQTFGVCLEASPLRPTERTFFAVQEPFSRSLVLDGTVERSRRELKLFLRGRPGAVALDGVKEYQAELLHRLGGLSDRFFDVFLRALAFQPMRDVRQFVEQWILPRGGLDVTTLKAVTDRLHDLRLQAEEVAEQLRSLDVIVERQQEVRRLRELQGDHVGLGAELQLRLSSQALASALAARDALLARFAALQAELDDTHQRHAAASEEHLAKLVQFRQADDTARRQILEGQSKQLERELAQARHASAKSLGALRRLLSAASDWLATPEATVIAGQAAAAAAQNDVKEGLDALEKGKGEGTDLGLSLDEVRSRLAPWLTTATDAASAKRAQLAALLSQGREIEAQIKVLEHTQRPSYRREVEGFRRILTEATGTQPPLLCELLEVPEEVWQDAVEAMLGARRFLIIPEAELFPEALRLLERHRQSERLYDVGVLDLAKAGSEGRAPKPGSLAMKVYAGNPQVQAYINQVLGDIMTCANAADLRHHRRAVTADVLAYSEWSVRAIPPSRFRPWFIGTRTRQSQKQMLAANLAALADEAAVLSAEGERMSSLLEELSAWRLFADHLTGLAAAGEAMRLESAVQQLKAELAGDPSQQHQALALEVRRLEGAVAELGRQQSQLATEVGRVGAQAEELGRRAAEARLRVAADSASLDATLAQLAQKPDLREIRRNRIAALAFARLAETPLDEALRNTEAAAKGFETRAQNEMQKLVQEATAFNVHSRFVGRPHDAEDSGFADERARLAGIELPRYRDEIGQEAARAEHELREHVLHRLREQIATAKAHIDRLNRALGKLRFRDERYRFKWAPSEELHEFYRLIVETKALGAHSLLESDYYRDNQALFERFYQHLTATPTTDRERQAQDRFTDYRSYLTYDIEIVHADGQVSRLSRIVGETSGGESQTPFYLAIAASFLQLFEASERLGRPTIRLVAFDEAFSKMDQQRIGSTLDLFHAFGLQIVTATPLERCEYLAPKMRTSLVVTAIGDHAHVEPYRNYAVAARIEPSQLPETVVSADGAVAPGEA